MSHTVIFILLFLVSIVINVSLSQRMNQQTHATQILEAGDDDATKIATLEFILVSTFDAISSRGWWWCQQNINFKFYQVYCVLLCVAGYVCQWPLLPWCPCVMPIALHDFIWTTSGKFNQVLDERLIAWLVKKSNDIKLLEGKNLLWPISALCDMLATFLALHLD